MLNESNDSRVLDIGSGLEAIWATDVASTFPEVEVYAIDLIPVETRFVPQNLNTEVWDITDGLPYPGEYLNLVHIHCLLWWTPHMYQNTILEALRCLRVGGFLIIEEPDTAKETSRYNGSSLYIQTLSTETRLRLFSVSLRELVESTILEDGGRFDRVEEESFKNHVGPRTDIIQTPLEQENSLELPASRWNSEWVLEKPASRSRPGRPKENEDG
ncbi:hypothetical protein BDY24DRAFT_185683 [Mrakia frigida]|uniref:class I SAM-dependent methyltransferase n=1 Tax=Mrakia frigida TaxID=29902 RepID=UPI003FCC0278